MTSSPAVGSCPRPSETVIALPWHVVAQSPVNDCSWPQTVPPPAGSGSKPNCQKYFLPGWTSAKPGSSQSVQMFQELLPDGTETEPSAE